MKILSIGNSFSADAHVYLHDLATQRGLNLETVNVAIGGCSLQRHWDNIVNNSTSYLLNVNGGEEWEKDLVSIEQILKGDVFDVITLQQVSGYSGEYDSYQPYLNNIISYIRKFQPNARLYIHRTWAYEIDSTHSDFPRYDNDQAKMHEAICQATSKASEETGASLISSVDVIYALRRDVAKFDYKNGGESLCRDGFHLSTYARYAVALTWLATLTGSPVAPLPFMEFDFDLITKTCEIVNKITEKEN
jgi:hypothetical protein